MKRRKRRSRAASVLWFIPAIAWLAVLFYLSGQDGGESGQLSRWLAEGILRRLPFLDVDVLRFEIALRKLAHVGIFAVEGFLLRIAMGQARPARFGNIMISLVACAALAVLNELHQTTAEGRVCSTTDMLIDTAGALAGALVAAMLENLIWAAIHRRRKRLDR